MKVRADAQSPPLSKRPIKHETFITPRGFTRLRKVIHENQKQNK